MEGQVTHEGAPGLSLARQMLLTISFVVGIAGNIAVLWILFKSAKTRNSKHVLMLRCLATNDLVAQLGMLVLMYLQIYELIPVNWRCVLYVCLRAFGLGSGCVAFVMAAERWLALTRPFLYQQVITYRFLQRTIFGLWALAVFLTCLPLMGFGLYYNNGKCCRYRDASEQKDVIYAYLFLTFGTTLCLCIALCNTSVFCTLSRTNSRKRVLVRRMSRSIINRIDCKQQYATAEELAFAKLMAFLCIIFILCWMPQMISIPLARFAPESNFHRIFSRIANILMCVYFTLDPYVYVLHQYMEKGRFRLPCTNFWSAGNALATPSSTTGTPTSVLLHPPTFTIPATT